MDNLRLIHSQALEKADNAYSLKRQGDYQGSIQAFTEAFYLEFRAAELSVKEPTRSILYRSAATLALHAELHREAEIAVSLGLAGEPPPVIADELRDVFDQINFRRHLRLQGIELITNELQLSFIGDVVSQGMALFEPVMERIVNLQKLILRTAHRINKKTFITKLPSTDMYNLYVSTAREGSYAVTLRIGEQNQHMLPEFDNKPQIIDEVLYNISLLNDNRIQDLKENITDQLYYENFLGLSKSVAPDGKKIKMVGLTTKRNGKEQSISFTRTSKDIKPMIQVIEETKIVESQNKPPVSITGELLFADAINNSRVKIQDDNQKTWNINVSKSLAEDVVRPFFGKRVTIEAKWYGNKLILQDIESID